MTVMLPRWFRYPALVLILLSASPLFGAPKLEEWTDTQGTQFRGEPSEVLGPLALFRTGYVTGRHLALRYLTDQDCVRFYEGAKATPARANDWAEAKSSVSLDLKGNVSRLTPEGKLVSAEFKGRREPQFYIVFFASNGEGNSWGMLSTAVPLYSKLKGIMPDEFEGVYFGLRHNAYEHSNMVKSLKLPWLVCDLHEQGKIAALGRFAPGAGYSMLIVTRNGIPLFAAQDPEPEKVKELFASLAGMLDLMLPENPKAWPDRQHYLKAVQPVAHPQGVTEPVLVGNPLRADGLVQRKVLRFNAAINVAADGSVSGVTMSPDELLPEKMSDPIANALKKAVFVPAVENGKYVDGVYHYHFEAPK